MGPLIMALSSAVAYGASDFLGGLASRRVAVLRVLMVSYPVSSLLVTVAAFVAGGSADVASLVWGALSGIALAVAAWTFYLALAVGPISVISPITALLSAAVPMGVGLALGERPDATSMLGVGLALVAVVLVSLAPHADTKATHPFTRFVALLTVGAGLSFAFSYVFTGQIAEGTGLWPIVVARWTATVAVFAVAASRSSMSPPRGGALAQAAAIGVLDAIAHLTMLLALQQGLLSIGSVVISLFPAVTVILAVSVLREKLTRTQIGGLALGAIAIGLIGA